MPVKNATRILWTSVIMGLVFDLLFWNKPLGVSYFIFVLVVTIAGFTLAWMENIKPSVYSWLIAIMGLGFSAMTFLRQEPFTNFINALLSLICLAFLALTFSSGLWIRYSVADVVAGILRLAGSALAAGSGLLASPRNLSGDSEMENKPAEKSRISIWAIIRGLLLAFPIVFFLALLLVSADPAFSKELAKLLDIEKFLEYAIRLMMVGIIGYLLSGIYSYAISKSKRTDLIGLEKPWFSAFLGFTESSIVLVGVNLLFAFFVTVQFKYFFGGQENIMVDGYTYAEYARKGFGELVWVAILSLILFLGLSAVTRRGTANKQRWFSGFCLVLVCLVGVILVSSFMRLSLLEDAYGFTRLRAYSHVFMVWLGILLAAVMVLEIIPYRRGFAITAFLALIGFGLTLNLMNIDGFIVKSNVARTNSGKELDYQYFQELSTDSVAQTLEEFRSTEDEETKHLLGVALVCRTRMLEDQLQDWQWQGYHVSFNSALTLLRTAQPELTNYRLVEDNPKSKWSYSVRTPIGEKDCYKSYRDID